MKVNIRYSVELEEVLLEMTDLHRKAEAGLKEKLNTYERFFEGTFKDSDVDWIITALEHNIISYQDHQTKLAEVLNIMHGYKNIKEGKLTPPDTAPSAQPPGESGVGDV
jgi:hypothetical protein|tara:strand:+ start:629 stop:955 length:327 start_codon:yes stop_codon:yes gene_type:complete